MLDGLDSAPLCGPEVAAPSLQPVKVHVVTVGVPDDVGMVVFEATRRVWGRLGLTVERVGSTKVGVQPLLFDAKAPTPAGQLAPMQAVLDALPDAAGAVPLVVMADFVAEGSALDALRGLTLPAADADIESGLPEAVLVTVRRPSVPVVFIDAGAGPRAPGDLSLAPAHELGHALGLSHRAEDDVLMSAGDLSLRCVPGLSVEEWQTVRASTEGGG
mgnify:CR=1 FL=1